MSSTNAVGTPQNLSTAYAYYFERQTADPGAGAWSEADVNGMELVLESAIGES